jgi:hypothetical protein
MPEYTICRGVLALLKENERLRAALADSCEEHRAEIFDATTGGGCMLLHDAVAAERERCLDVRLSDDDALRFACRVLESDAPAADKAAARDGLMAIRTRIRA